MSSSTTPDADPATQPPTNKTPSTAVALTSFKRKKRLINRRMQLKLVAVFGAIGVICSLFQVVLVNLGLLEIARNSSKGGEAIMDVAQGMMLENVAWTVGAMIPLMICVGLTVTHRIAGPAFRMTEHCLAIAAGEPVRPCKVRDHDELQELCDALNAALARLSPPREEPGETTSAWDLEATPSLVQAGLVTAQEETSEDDEETVEQGAKEKGAA